MKKMLAVFMAALALSGCVVYTTPTYSYRYRPARIVVVPYTNYYMTGGYIYPVGYYGQSSYYVPVYRPAPNVYVPPHVHVGTAVTAHVIANGLAYNVVIWDGCHHAVVDW